MIKEFMSNQEFLSRLKSREKLLLPLGIEMTQYYPLEIREDYRAISEQVLESGEPFLYKRIAVIDSSDIFIEDWVQSLDFLLKSWGEKIYIPLPLFFNENFDMSNLNEFLYEITRLMKQEGWTDLDLNVISFLIIL